MYVLIFWPETKDATVVPKNLVRCRKGSGDKKNVEVLYGKKYVAGRVIKESNSEEWLNSIVVSTEGKIDYSAVTPKTSPLNSSSDDSESETHDHRFKRINKQKPKETNESLEEIKSAKAKKKLRLKKQNAVAKQRDDDLLKTAVPFIGSSINLVECSSEEIKPSKEKRPTNKELTKIRTDKDKKKENVSVVGKETVKMNSAVPKDCVASIHTASSMDLAGCSSEGNKQGPEQTAASEEKTEKRKSTVMKKSDFILKNVTVAATKHSRLPQTDSFSDSDDSIVDAVLLNRKKRRRDEDIEKKSVALQEKGTAKINSAVPKDRVASIYTASSMDLAGCSSEGNKKEKETTAVSEARRAKRKSTSLKTSDFIFENVTFAANAPSTLPQNYSSSDSDNSIVDAVLLNRKKPRIFDSDVESNESSRKDAADNAYMTTSDDRELEPHASGNESLFLEMFMKQLPPLTASTIKFMKALTSGLENIFETMAKNEARRGDSSVANESESRGISQSPNCMDMVGIPGDNKIELQVNSQIFIKKDELQHIMQYNNDPRNMVRRLMRQIVGDRRLRGMSATGRGRRPGIPEKIRSVVASFVRKNSAPGTAKLRPGQYKRTLNLMCSSLRAQYKNTETE